MNGIPWSTETLSGLAPLGEAVGRIEVTETGWVPELDTVRFTATCCGPVVTLEGVIDMVADIAMVKCSCYPLRSG